MKLKRVFLIIAFVIVAIGLGLLIYFIFLKDIIGPKPNANANTNQNTNGFPTINRVANVNRTTTNINVPATNSMPPTNANTNMPTDTARGGLTTVKTTVNSNVQGATSVVDGLGVRYYDANSGKFFTVDESGNIRELSDQVFANVQNVAWSPRENKAVITFPDQSKILYDFNGKQQTTLPKEWDGISFSQTGDKIGFKNMSSTERERWLAVARPDGTEVQLIEPIGDKGNDVAVNWSPTGQVVSLFRQSSSGTSQEVLMIGLHDENFKSIQTDGRNFQGKWSPQGDQLLYTVQNSESRYNPTLHLVDASGDLVGANDLNLNIQTWIDRCTFSAKSNYVYCAVPTFLSDGSGFYPELATKTNDTIYKIDRDTGSKSIVALPSFFGGQRDYSVISVLLSNDEKFLYFKDGVSGQLFQIKLK